MTNAMEILLSSEKIWFSLPQYFRFLASGGIGNIILFFMDASLYNQVIKKITFTENVPTILKNNKESLSFFIAYLGQIIIQHYLHAVLVFGRDTINSREKYLKTLKTTYATLFGILLGSTVCNAMLLEHGVPKNIAFWLTLYGFGIVSYLILKLASLTVKDEGVICENKKNMRKEHIGGRQMVRGGAILCNRTLSSSLCTPFINCIMDYNGRCNDDIKSTKLERGNWGEWMQDNVQKGQFLHGYTSLLTSQIETFAMKRMNV